MNRCRPRPDRDAGMTMAELAVSMTVFLVLLTATLLVTIQVQQLYVQQTASEDSLQAARHAMDICVKDLRAAETNKIGGTLLAFSETTGTAVTFYVNSTAGRVRERIYLDGAGKLWRQTTQPDTSSADPSYTYTTNRGQKTDQLASGVSAATAGTPIFSYVVNGVVSTSVTTDPDRAVISAVVVTLSDTARTGAGAAPVTLVNTVNPLNL